MFGFSFGEILVIAIIAVIFLGPDKLPKAFVDIAKFIKAVKKTINDAKDMIDREVHISEIKQEALEYKKQFESSVTNIKDDIAKSADINEVTNILNAPLESSSINPPINSMEELEYESKKMMDDIAPAKPSRTTLKKTKKTSDKAIKSAESSVSPASTKLKNKKPKTMPTNTKNNNADSTKKAKDSTKKATSAESSKKHTAKTAKKSSSTKSTKTATKTIEVK